MKEQLLRSKRQETGNQGLAGGLHLVELVVVGHWEDHGVDLPEQLDIVGGDIAQVGPAQLRHLCKEFRSQKKEGTAEIGQYRNTSPA